MIPYSVVKNFFRIGRGLERLNLIPDAMRLYVECRCQHWHVQQQAAEIDRLRNQNDVLAQTVANLLAQRDEMAAGDWQPVGAFLEYEGTNHSGLVRTLTVEGDTLMLESLSTETGYLLELAVGDDGVISENLSELLAIILPPHLRLCRQVQRPE